MARILIIDDDDIQRRIVREILEAGAHDVTEAEDGNQGLRLQNEQVFDLIITDILMPGMEGLETVRELARVYPGVRIIAMSGHREGYLRAASSFGAMATLEKPFAPGDLS
ncbi:MAG: response regulator, partial [Rhodospirillaceae bacterium]|nr:response regulator [Rhodospirillaceae bacterium]